MMVIDVDFNTLSAGQAGKLADPAFLSGVYEDQFFYTVKVNLFYFCKVEKI